jgi:hypothetical protein
MPTLAAVQSSCAFASPRHLDRALQRELAVLAALEADHCSACRWLDEWSGPKAVKEDVACRLDARHRTEREAHVLRLAELHQQRMLLAISDETGERTDEASVSPSCLVPDFDGAFFSPEWRDALWAKFFTGAPARQRRCVARSSIVKRA